MSNGIIRWGIVSTGRIAHQFAKDFQYVNGGQIVACASRTQNHAREFARQHGISRVYRSTDELLAADDIDAVYIASPHTLHCQNSIDAMRAGKAVLCEKPLTINVAQCEQLIEVQRETGAFLMEAMWTYFLPAIQRAKQWVDEGRIGKLVQLKVDFGFPQRPYSPNSRVYNHALGGGALLDMGIYPVAIASLFLDDEPSAVHTICKHAPNGVDDDLSAVLDYGDCIATLGTSFRCRLVNSAYLIGEDGHIEIPNAWMARRCDLYQSGEQVDRFDDGRQTQGLCYETQAVIDDLRAGRVESATMPLATSLRFQKVMAAIRAG